MPATLPLNPRHEEWQDDRATSKSPIVELAMVPRRTERRFACIAEESPAFGAGPFNGGFLGSAYVVILSVAVCAYIQYGNAPVNTRNTAIAMNLIDGLHRVMSAIGPDDRISRPAGSAEELHLQILAQIRDNMSLHGKMLTEQGKTLNDMNGRLIRVEERDERIHKLQEGFKELDGKVDVLLRDKDERAGVKQVIVGVRGWTPVLIAIIAAIASIFSAIYLAGRGVGMISAPPTHSRLEGALGQAQGVDRTLAQP